ncbi:MAG TPA: carbohydrate binding family 9 domain-containing protein [Bacteroidales bacterium]|nr:carbohydrate binding family 9 domain-containing protein [Bacteroidales bacterium]
MKKLLLAAALLITVAVTAKSASPGKADTLKPTLPVVKINEHINLSGKMDDPLWLQAMPVELNYEVMPAENTPAKQKTVASVLYNNDYLYFGFRCYDSQPSAIRANLSDRDKMFGDDFIVVSIDTYNNYQKGLEFAVNPFGIQGDLMMMGSGNEDSSYDMVWHSAASVDNEGWIAEMAIPFSVFSFNSAAIQDWTITLCRSLPRDSRYLLSWTMLDRNNPSWLGQGGLLKGLEGIKPGKSLSFLPYIMLEQKGERSDVSDPESPMELSKLKARIGGGITYSPGPNTTINAVINPDFSQIESDAGQISVNSTFALYYPEKRPFFMSGMDLLQTPMYYTRTINNPLFAAKINGKAGRFSYLALAADDRNTSVIVPGEEQSNTVTTEERSFAGVARIRYDMENENFVGALFLNRNFTDAHNYLGGLDWNLKFWKNWYWQGELFLSHTREMNNPDLFNSTREFGSTGKDAAFNGEKYYGTGMHLALMRAGRKYSFTLVQNNFSPTYQTYNGMFPEVNGRNSYMNHSYTFHINKKFIQRIRLSSTASLGYNYDGVFKEFIIQPSVYISMIGQTSLNYSYMAVNQERFRDVLFKGVNRSQFMIETTPLKGVSVSFSGSAGRYIRRSEVPELGKGYNLATELSLEPTSWLKTSFSWSTARLESIASGDEFYNGHIFRNVTTLQFTRKLFIRGIGEYNTFSNSFNIYPLVSYKFNAFTMFCAGMTQDYLEYNLDENNIYRTTGHQYFVKLQYLFTL